jgi:hypothetical protein
MRYLCILALICAVAPSVRAQQPGPSHDTGEPFGVRFLPAMGPVGSIGRVTGEACGVGFNYDVHRRGPDRLELGGFLDGNLPSRIELRMAPNQHHLAGALGTSAGDAVVDLQLTEFELSGRVGWRRFELRSEGDTLQGPMQIAGAAEPGSALVRGRAALWTLPPAEQAAVLPLLLTCYVPRIGLQSLGRLEVGVGGPEGYLPAGSSAVYSHF